LSGRSGLFFDVPAHCPRPVSFGGGGSPPERIIQRAHQIADTDGKYELPIDCVKNLFPVAGDDEKLFASVRYLRDSRARPCSAL
jgi:hypothetical protein